MDMCMCMSACACTCTCTCVCCMSAYACTCTCTCVCCMSGMHMRICMCTGASFSWPCPVMPHKNVNFKYPNVSMTLLVLNFNVWRCPVRGSLPRSAWARLFQRRRHPSHPLTPHHSSLTSHRSTHSTAGARNWVVVTYELPKKPAGFLNRCLSEDRKRPDRATIVLPLKKPAAFIEQATRAAWMAQGEREEYVTKRTTTATIATTTMRNPNSNSNSNSDPTPTPTPTLTT